MKRIFARMRPDRRQRSARAALLVLVAIALVVGLSGNLMLTEPEAQSATADEAIVALRAGDFRALDDSLADHLGQPDFAYFFTSAATPRALGDLLATASAPDAASGAGDGFDYEIALTRLAGTLALGTQAPTGRELPASWTERFVQATIDPLTMDGADQNTDGAAERRADQDVANQQNLLLLLSRGTWSTEFLQAVTAAFYEADRREGPKPWPVPTVEAKYALAPNGALLTDGVLALAAALTANPEASRWAFTEFQPAAVRIDGTDRSINKFTHYLFVEHEFPKVSTEAAGAESLGMTTTLTALSSAIEAGSGDSDSSAPGPAADAAVLQDLAKSSVDNADRSLWSRSVDAVANFATSAWRWVQRWGHRIADMLSLAPLPLGSVAAGVNALWYTIDGDYADAGLSLAAVVPALAYVKIAKDALATGKATKSVVEVERVAARSDLVAKVAAALKIFPWQNCKRALKKGGLALKYDPKWTPEQRAAALEKVKALSKAGAKGQLKKSVVLRVGDPRGEYKRAGGTIRADQDIDHVIDLQLGGSQDVSNLRPLDPAINRSIGKQIGAQLMLFDPGQAVPSVAIC